VVHSNEAKKWLADSCNLPQKSSESFSECLKSRCSVNYSLSLWVEVFFLDQNLWATASRINCSS